MITVGLDKYKVKHTSDVQAVIFTNVIPEAAFSSALNWHDVADDTCIGLGTFKAICVRHMHMCDTETIHPTIPIINRTLAIRPNDVVTVLFFTATHFHE